MTDRFLSPNGSCPDWQPEDRIIMPGAVGFDALCNRLIARFGWAKNEPDHPWVGQTPIGKDDDGLPCMVVETRKRTPGQSKYGIIYGGPCLS